MARFSKGLSYRARSIRNKALYSGKHKTTGMNVHLERSLRIAGVVPVGGRDVSVAVQVKVALKLLGVNDCYGRITAWTVLPHGW
jgi:hypothetical protein